MCKLASSARPDRAYHHLAAARWQSADCEIRFHNWGTGKYGIGSVTELLNWYFRTTSCPIQALLVVSFRYEAELMQLVEPVAVMQFAGMLWHCIITPTYKQQCIDNLLEKRLTGPTKNTCPISHVTAPCWQCTFNSIDGNCGYQDKTASCCFCLSFLLGLGKNWCLSQFHSVIGSNVVTSVTGTTVWWFWASPVP